MTGKIITALLLTTFCHCTEAQQRTFNIVALGAKNDGQTNNTIVIQKAIDEASASGGGVVMIPAGKFVTGVIELKSGVILQLAANAILLGSTKRIDYGANSASALIVANGQHHIGITGRGTINGQGPLLLKDIYRMLNDGTLQDSEWKTENPWHQVRPEERNRPKLIEFKNCDTILIKGITIRDGLCWVQNYKNCSHLLVDSIHVESNTMWNNDGIDLVDCNNARVTNSFFNADDDGICLKSEDRNRRCENIYIAHCRIRSSASAVKFGTASRGGFKNITIRNITVYDTYRSAIALEAVDGAVLEDVDIRNIKAFNTGNAVFIRLGHRNKDSVVSKIRNIYIANVTVTVPKGKPDRGYPMEGPPLNYAHNIFPASVTGLPGHPVEHVVLDNINIVYAGRSSKDSAFVSPDSLTSIPENAKEYPEFSMFGELPAWGWYARHVTGLIIKNSRVSVKQQEFRPAMVFDDINGLTLQSVTVASGKQLPVIVINNSVRLNMKSNHFPVTDKRAVRIYTAKPAGQ